MGKVIKTKIDGVPVELEFLGSDEASLGAINALSTVSILDGRSSLNRVESDKPILTSDNAIKLISVGSGDKVSQEDVDRVKEKVTQSDTATLIANLLEHIQNLPADIEIWQSKTFWVNVIAIVCAAATYFGYDWNLTSEQTTLITTIIILISSSINVYLRKGTDRKIKSLFSK
jgi:hypothetical protein